MDQRDSFSLPAGYGLRRLSASEFAESGTGLRGLHDRLLVWESPRRPPQHREYRYVVAADTGDGLGQDLTVCDVLRVGTLSEPPEQVAQYVTDSVTPEDFAPILDVIGRWYQDQDQYEAHMVIETNGHGLAAQALLQKHYGYSHFYRWQYEDKARVDHRWSNAIGWATTPRTRPILLSHLMSTLRQVDPITSHPGIVIHSPITYSHLADFYSPTGRLEDAEATRGAHDDAVITIAMASYAAMQLVAGETEPVSDRRHRAHQEAAARAKAAGEATLDFRNTDCTADEMDVGLVAGVEAAGMLSEDELREVAADLTLDA